MAKHIVDIYMKFHNVTTYGNRLEKRIRK